METNKTYEEMKLRYETLLQEAADKLQDYCSELHGDLNDSLAIKIYEAIGKKFF